MVKITLEDREAFQTIDDRLNNAASDFVENCDWLQGSQRKVIRGKLAQIASCFLQKVKRNTRLVNDDWSDVEDDEPEAKRAKKERLEPEDLVLKKRVEDLRKQVQEASKKVKNHRQNTPAKILEAEKSSLEQTNTAFEQALSSAEIKAQAAPKPDYSISDACREAFVEDAAAIASSVASLREKIPRQMAKGRVAVSVGKEWLGKPLSGADAVIKDSKDANSTAQAQQMRLAYALRQRQ